MSKIRLLHSKTLQFHTFNEAAFPPYLILSHTWGAAEVTYQEMCYLHRIWSLPEDLKANSLLLAAMSFQVGLSNIQSEAELTSRAGYRKICDTAELARGKSFDYFWIDTCCIDKSSSAELQESINSMYRWYQMSTLCAVLLEDTNLDTKLEKEKSEQAHEDYIINALKSSRWITRGWTLQELIAPSAVIFYDQKWTFMLDKLNGCKMIGMVTGISVEVLLYGDLRSSSIAKKMSWAADRSTTRVEDRAYSLMGIFGIHMPMIYGEGEKAFQRLQEEIMRTSTDSSIFAWENRDADHTTFSGLLAKSPNDFSSDFSGAWASLPIALTNRGLRLEATLRRFTNKHKEELHCLYLGDPKHSNASCCLILRKLEIEGDDIQFTRVNSSFLEYLELLGELPPSAKRTVIFVRQIPVIPRDLMCAEMHCFQIQNACCRSSLLPIIVRMAWPKQHWEPSKQKLRIPSGGRNFIGMMRLFSEPFGINHTILLGHRTHNGSSWCRVVKDDGPFWEDPVGSKRKILDTYGPFHECKLHDTFEGASSFEARLEPGLCDGKISQIIHIRWG